MLRKDDEEEGYFHNIDIMGCREFHCTKNCVVLMRKLSKFNKDLNSVDKKRVLTENRSLKGIHDKFVMGITADKYRFERERDQLPSEAGSGFHSGERV